MRKLHGHFSLLALVLLGSCGGSEQTAEVVIPLRTGPVRRLVLARPFTIAEPYVHCWSAEQASVNAGWLLVLEVDPSYVEPRQAAMPVLLIGDQTVECVNFGRDTGMVVAIAPSPTDAQGLPALDLATADAWFGPPELPERVDSGWIAGARARARTGEAVRFASTEIATARARGGAMVRVADRVELERQAARLILEYAPRERELAEGLLVPVTR